MEFANKKKNNFENIMGRKGTKLENIFKFLKFLFKFKLCLNLLRQKLKKNPYLEFYSGCNLFFNLPKAEGYEGCLVVAFADQFV